MSSFDALETSRESSRPIEIFQFTVDSDFYRYTSAEDDLTIDGQDYTAVAITRNNVVQGSDSQARNLLVTMPGNNEFAALFRNIVPGVRVSVTVWRLQRDESPSFATKTLVFKGQVLSVRYPQDGYTAEVVCRTIEQAMNRNIPRFTFAGMCGHVLYDTRCGVDPGPYSHLGVVTAVDGNTITIAGADGQPDQYYRGGYCRPVSGAPDFRMVIAHEGEVVTMLLPFASNVIGSLVQVFAGCNHLITGDCALKFDNVEKYGGWPYVPNRNPFEVGLY